MIVRLTLPVASRCPSGSCSGYRAKKNYRGALSHGAPLTPTVSPRLRVPHYRKSPDRRQGFRQIKSGHFPGAIRALALHLLTPGNPGLTLSIFTLVWFFQVCDGEHVNYKETHDMIQKLPLSDSEAALVKSPPARYFPANTSN